MGELRYLIDGPEDADWTLILAHGAGQGMDSDFTAFFGRELGRSGLRVTRFEFPYMAEMTRSGRRRAPDREPVLREAWNSAIDTVVADGVGPERLLIGGKSLGGRMASLIADACGASGLVCLGYPFHPPGKPERLRVEHLRAIVTPTLICQGTRDTFGRSDEVPTYGLSPTVRLAWIEDGDHSFRPRKKSGRTWEQNLRQAADAVTGFAKELRVR